METNHYLLAQLFNIAVAQTMTKDDEDGIAGVTTSTGYFRTKLAASVGIGSEDNPFELINNVQFALGAKWVVTMRDTGKIRIQYIGTGTGEITWTDTGIRNLLGFSTTIGPLATNAFVDAPYLPTHCIFAPASDDAGWQQIPGKSAIQRMPDGTTYGWQDGYTNLRRIISFTFLPTDETARALIDSAGTNAISSAAYRINPALGNPYQDPPWSVPQTVATSAGNRSAFTDNLQGIIDGSVTSYDIVYLDAESFKGVTSLNRDGYDLRRNSGSFVMSWVIEGTV